MPARGRTGPAYKELVEELWARPFPRLPEQGRGGRRGLRVWQGERAKTSRR